MIWRSWYFNFQDISCILILVLFDLKEVNLLNVSKCRNSLEMDLKVRTQRRDISDPPPPVMISGDKISESRVHKICNMT